MLDLDASLLIVFAIVWILLLVLRKVFFKPMDKVRGERNDLINRDNKAFAEAQENHERTLQEIEDKVRKARAEAQAIRDSLEEEALKEKDRLVKAVSDESRDQVETAKAELESRMKALIEEMEAKSRELAESIEKRLLH